MGLHHLQCLRRGLPGQYKPAGDHHRNAALYRDGRVAGAGKPEQYVWQRRKQRRAMEV